MASAGGAGCRLKKHLLVNRVIQPALLTDPIGLVEIKAVFSSDAMPFDVSFKKLNLAALSFNDIFNEVADRYNANDLACFKDW